MSIASLITGGFFDGIPGLILEGLELAQASGDTHDGWSEKHRRRLKKTAKLAEEAIYRNVPKPVIAIPVRKAAIEAVVSEAAIPPPQIYEVGRMPLANPLQWLLDDDEEAIKWLM